MAWNPSRRTDRSSKSCGLVEWPLSKTIHSMQISGVLPAKPHPTALSNPVGMRSSLRCAPPRQARAFPENPLQNEIGPRLCRRPAAATHAMSSATALSEHCRVKMPLRRASILAPVPQPMSGTRGSGVPTRSGPDARPRVLEGIFSEGIQAPWRSIRVHSGRTQMFRNRTGQSWPPNTNGPRLTRFRYSGRTRWLVSPRTSSSR